MNSQRAAGILAACLEQMIEEEEEEGSPAPSSRELARTIDEALAWIASADGLRPRARPEPRPRSARVVALALAALPPPVGGAPSSTA